MTNLYKIEDLRPLYEVMLTRERLDAATLTKRLAENIRNIEHDGMAIVATAVRLRWLEGIVEWCERSAGENGGMVDRKLLQEHIDNRLVSIARGGVWSSNPFKSLVEREELEVLARAKEPFGAGLMQPFDSIDDARRREEWQAKREASHWRIKKGKMYRKVYGGLTRDVEKAMLWTYETRPELEPGQSYELVEA